MAAGKPVQKQHGHRALSVLKALLWLWDCVSPPPPFFFPPHGKMGAGQARGSDICLTCHRVGRQPGLASGRRTWKQFQVLYFRQHNRSEMCFYPQVHSEQRMHAHLAGAQPGYLSVYRRARPGPQKPRSRWCWRLPDVAAPLGWQPLTHPPAPCAAPRLVAVPALLPATLPGLVLCSLLRFCRSGGEEWRRRGENITEGQKGNEDRSILHPLRAPRSLSPGAVCHV